MTVSELQTELKLTAFALPRGDREIEGGYVGDLLSWVMGRAESGDAWITIMNNINVIAVAQLADVACVIFAEGVTPDEKLTAAAMEHEINLLSANVPAFTVCAAISRLL